jgi:predicted nucleotidyltransferase
MNIKKDIRKDKNLFDDLIKATFVKVEVGSKMYGLEHKDSDTDLLCIYNTSKRELNMFDRSHHQIQFKVDGVDYLFINIHSFLSNALSGDSTINFEVINSEKLLGTELDFLYKFREYFYNYKIIRSYLGLARRDLKRIDVDGKTEFGKNKKIAHAYRGLNTAVKIYNIKYGHMNEDSIFLYGSDINEIKTFIWTLKDWKERKKYSEKLMEDINDFRIFINSKYDDDELIAYMSVDNQKVINSALELLFENTETTQMKNFDMSDFYDANENDIKY